MREVGAHPIIKVKLGKGAEIETLEAIRSIYTGTIRVDANEGWDAEQSVALLRELAQFDIEFCEQPIPAGTPEQLRWIRERSPIPIVTDEDSKDAARPAGAARLRRRRQREARQVRRHPRRARDDPHRARDGLQDHARLHGRVADPHQPPRAHLSPLVDWADLDGPFLTARDPFAGITYAPTARSCCRDGPGLGVRQAEAR